MKIDAVGRGADLDNVFIAANYHGGEKNPLNPDSARARPGRAAGGRVTLLACAQTRSSGSSSRRHSCDSPS